MAIAILQCTACGSVTPSADVLRRQDWLLPCPPPCGGERVVVDVNDHIEDRRWRDQPVRRERRRPLPA